MYTAHHISILYVRTVPSKNWQRFYGTQYKKDCKKTGTNMTEHIVSSEHNNNNENYATKELPHIKYRQRNAIN